MAGIADFRDLDVYKIAFQASLKIHKVSENFPKSEQFSLTSQIRRCSKSICANIAEGFEKQRHSKAEFKRYLYISVGSSAEMLVWLDYCVALNYMDETGYEQLQKEYVRIKSMLNSFITKL